MIGSQQMFFFFFFYLMLLGFSSVMLYLYTIAECVPVCEHLIQHLMLCARALHLCACV